jgi:hypothetical protein
MIVSLAGTVVSYARNSVGLVGVPALDITPILNDFAEFATLQITIVDITALVLAGVVYSVA